MKKLLTVSLLGVLLSIPSVVFAEASWYGSIRTGIESNASNNSGVAGFGSRWGIRGSSEVSEGLTAVYQYERGFDSTNATESPQGRVSYVGLSGGFGTLTVGHIWAAAYNHFGGIVDQAQWYGSTGPANLRHSDAVSYSVSVGNVSLQADALMDQATPKTGDGFQFGATLGGLMETGSIAIAHRKFADVGPASQSASFIAGNYGIGDMTVFIGYSQDSKDNGVSATCTAASITATTDSCVNDEKEKFTYAGVHGGVGDTGVNYVFTMRSEKKSTNGFGWVDADDDDTFDAGENVATPTSSSSNPWTLGLNRSLGGGATLRFEHGEPDSTTADSTTAVWLQVDF